MISTRLGKGVALSLIDSATSYDRDLVKRVYALGIKHHLDVQFKQTATGGNDAGSIHVSAGGIKTLTLSIPARYIHSPVSVISQKDYESAKELARTLIREVQHV